MEDSYKKLFDLSLDILCIASAKGYFIDVNKAFARILGYSKEEALSKPIVDFVHPDDVEDTLKELGNLMAGENTVNFRNRYITKSGEVVTLLWSARPNGENHEVFASARDISELVKSESVKGQFEKILFDETIVAATDTNGVITNVNDKFCEVSGYTREELLGKTHKVVNSGNHPKAFFDNLWSTIKSGKTWTGLINNKTKDGDDYYVQSIITPIFDVHGEIDYFLSVRFETTDTVIAQQKLKTTLNFLNETSSIAKVGGWEMDVATEELTWTDETFRILEVEKKQGQNPILPEGLELFVEEHKAIIEAAVGDAVTKGIPYSLELKAQTAKGNVLWVYTNGKATYHNGEIVKISGTIQDIDARKKMEIKLEEERVKGLQSSKLASLGELAAGVAHEVNNPVAIIKGALELVELYREDPEKHARKIQQIDKSCDRIAHIVKSLQKFSHTKADAEKSWVSFSRLLEEGVALAKIKAMRSNVSIEVQNFVDGEDSILCQGVEIEQVIINLINNAVDEVGEREKPWIKIIVKEFNNQLRVEFVDSGKGIPIDVQDKLFDPFYTTKPMGKGTGLGLSITKGILDEHGANFYIDNENPNTSFVMEFPLRTEEKNVG